MIPRLSGNQATRPREGTVRRPPLAKFGCAASSLAGDAEGCYVGEAWRGCAAARVPVAPGRLGVPRGLLSSALLRVEHSPPVLSGRRASSLSR